MSALRRRAPGARLAIAVVSTTVLAVGISAPLAYADRTPEGASQGNRPLRAHLTGDMEAPGPGDPDGRGKARIKLRGTEICYKLSWSKIDAPSAAHIHEAAPGVPGPVVVPLPLAPVQGHKKARAHKVKNCVDVDPALIAEIREDPDNYYVNIHNAAFPGGAIRGQLHS